MNRSLKMWPMPKFIYIVILIIIFIASGEMKGQAHKYRGLPKHKVVLDYAKSLKEGFSEKYVKKIQENESNTVYLFRDSASLLGKHLVFYRKCDSTILSQFDVSANNPYKKYRQRGWVKGHPEGVPILNWKKDLPPHLVNNLSDGVIDRMPRIGSSYSVYSGCYQCPIIICYKYALSPNEEILEHISYPGLSSFMVLDNYTGKAMYDIQEFPFGLVEFPVIAPGSKYLAAGHMEMVSPEAKYLPYKDYFSMASIVNMENGEICYSDRAKDIYGVGVNSATENLILTKRNSDSLYLQRFLIDEKLYSIVFPGEVSVRYSKEGVKFIKSKKVIQESFFESDFQIQGIDCQ